MPAMAAAVMPGDVILRRGDGFWSAPFAHLNARDSRFSHVGVVVGGRELAVIHVEANELTGQGFVQRQPLSAFLAQSLAATVMRPRDPGVAERAADIAEALGRRAIPFDLSFDLETSEELYCSELAWLVLTRALGRDPLPEKPLVNGKRAILVENFPLDMTDVLVRFDIGNSEGSLQ